MRVPCLFLMLLSLNAYGEPCDEVITRVNLQKVIEETRLLYFPELIHTDISVKEFTSEAYYLQARPGIRSLVGRRSKRRYFVEVNTRLYKCPPPQAALEAIIAHELEHVLDYEKMSAFGIAGLGIRYGTSKKWRAWYERGTDQKVVEKGLARGLSEYRYWIYPKLSPKELELKKYFYMTPEELGF